MDKKKAFIEALKEIGRYGLLGIVAYLLTEGVIDGILANLGVVLDPQIKIYVVGGITAFLRYIDKFLHEAGKAIEGASVDKKGIVTETSILTGGLTRF